VFRALPGPCGALLDCHVRSATPFVTPREHTETVQALIPGAPQPASTKLDLVNASDTDRMFAAAFQWMTPVEFTRRTHSRLRISCATDLLLGKSCSVQPT
jgi:hypothetical protein